MRLNLLRPALIGSLFLVCLAEVGAPAQAAAQDAPSGPISTHDDDRGFDLGLLGLAGLAGLLGLRRRHPEAVRPIATSGSATSRV